MYMQNVQINIPFSLFLRPVQEAATEKNWQVSAFVLIYTIYDINNCHNHTKDFINKLFDYLTTRQKVSHITIMNVTELKSKSLSPNRN